MEKLQSAIAKARLARSQAQGEQVRVPRPAPQSGADRVREAWAGLTGFDPDPDHLQARRIVTLGHGTEATEFDKLRTRMLQKMQAHKWTRVAITSPDPASGKSTITLNLGFSLARQPSLRTMICEIDLKRPALAQILGAERKMDFSRVLSGIDPFADHAIRLRPNLAAGLVGHPVKESAELLQGPQVGQVLDAVEAEYAPDIMLFDMPPLTVSDDTIGFADKVDCALIVAAAGSTTVEEIDACERDLAERTEVLGVVLNKCRYHGPEQGYGYYD